jgi:hypothetical protein
MIIENALLVKPVSKTEFSGVHDEILERFFGDPFSVLFRQLIAEGKLQIVQSYLTFLTQE